jgi:hypothetical protein
VLAIAAAVYYAIEGDTMACWCRIAMLLPATSS